MKTKAKSYRFNEDDLSLAISKSGIKKTQQLMDFLLSEYVRDLKRQYAGLPADFMELKNVSTKNSKGEEKPLLKKTDNKNSPNSISMPQQTIQEQIESLTLELNSLGEGALANKRKAFLKNKIYELEFLIKYPPNQ